MAPVRRNQLARDISLGNISATNELVANLVRELTITPSGNVAFPAFSTFRDDSTGGIISQQFPLQQQQKSLLNQLMLEDNRNRINKQEIFRNMQFQQQPLLISRNNFNNGT